MKRRSKPDWPPAITLPPQIDPDDNSQKMHDGEPMYVYFDRFNQNERVGRGNMIARCCDCGLGHLFTFELHRTKVARFGLVVRGYRIDSTDAKQRARLKGQIERGKRRRR